MWKRKIIFIEYFLAYKKISDAFQYKRDTGTPVSLPKQYANNVDKLLNLARNNYLIVT